METSSGMDSKLIVALMAAVAALVVGAIAGFFAGRLSMRRRPASGGGAAPQPSQRGKKRATSCDLYIGNLPYGLGDDAVTGLLKAYGKVISLRIIADRASGASRGYGFATMGSPAEVDAAIHGLHNREIEGRRIVVNEAKSRPRDRHE